MLPDHCRTDARASYDLKELKARADVKNICIHIGKEQPRSAEKYFANFRRKVELLIEHPRLGERHQEVIRTARMLVEAPFVILYETRPDTDDGPY